MHCHARTLTSHCISRFCFAIQLYDTRTFKLMRTFQSDRALNSAAISPRMNHVIVGGGQEAANVTQSHSKAGKFEACFYNMVYGDFIGTVKGHFGPINTLAFNPDGKR